MLTLLVSCSRPAVGPSEPVGRFSAAGALDGDRMLVAGGAESLASILEDAWAYDLSQRSWRALPDMPAPTLRSTAVRLDDGLWFFGGTTSGFRETDALLRWDLDTGMWNEIPSDGPSARFKHAATSTEDAMLVSGGKNDDAEAVVCDDFWSFDPETGAWTSVSTTGGPGPVYRHGLAWDADRDTVWLHGGFDEDETRRDWLWKLDLDTAAWEEVTWDGAGPPERASHAFTVVPAGLLAWGGSAGDESSWLFDPEERTWTERAMEPAPLSRDAFSWDISADRSTLVIAGGDPSSEDVPDFVMDVWSMDVATGTWTELEPI